ncbi:uncharacterized protein GIQ15_06525 [Arthroderma uncinatum]|uniref:uncharacterized protein n=1 Tax=Arthroderma uncinatum TaxID=74035 RepID=UPI00144A7DE1|nr:uncharacterized protein GIQ15_06525 [Arthroderma uncinatum]KAF3479549.1 hypothetical protein GIQ15_06525 [Arthroderma uncinatum]
MAENSELGDIPPTFKIDLSLPPSQRYKALASLYRFKLKSLVDIFNELLTGLFGTGSIKWVHRVAPVLLKRLYTDEETEEIKGISEATGIGLYILVSLNVFLDLLMGCTSGAALTKHQQDLDAKMLHFRTLDWDMDELRQLIVKLEYIRSSESDTALATSVTYVGFVGVLTGVRKGLSISLNFRPCHDTSSILANYRFYGSHLLVLLGMRRSISSLLRKYLLSPNLEPTQRQSWLDRILRRKPAPRQNQTPLDLITASLPQIPTTAAYLVMCDGKSAVVFEKDHRRATIQRSSSFIVVTNSDSVDDSPIFQEDTPRRDENCTGAAINSTEPVGMDDVVFLSSERRCYMQNAWEEKVQAAKRVSKTEDSGNEATIGSSSTCRDSVTPRTDAGQRTCSSKSTKECSVGVLSDSSLEHQVTATPSEVSKWITEYPVTNEMTHFSAIMDPTLGTVAWVKRYLDPPPSNDNDNTG